MAGTPVDGAPAVPDGFALLLAGLAQLAAPTPATVATPATAAAPTAESRPAKVPTASPDITSAATGLDLPGVAQQIAAPPNDLATASGTAPVASTATVPVSPATAAPVAPPSATPVAASTAALSGLVVPVPTAASPAATGVAEEIVPALRGENGAGATEAVRPATVPVPTIQTAPELAGPPVETAASPGVAPKILPVADLPAALATGIEARTFDGGETEAASRSSAAVAPHTPLIGPQPMLARPARPESDGFRVVAVREAAGETDGASDATLDGPDPIPARVERPPSEPTSAASRPSTPPPAVQIAMQIARAVPAGVTRMLVQLEPARLGRVEVRLELGHDNRIAALITAEHPDTLDALQRGVRALERGLEHAGLRLDGDGLSFGLAERDPEGERRAHQHQPPSTSAGLPARGVSGSTGPPPSRATWIGVGLVDMRV